MARTRLLQAVCAAAMLAAVPAFAQSNNPVGQTGSSGDGTPQTPSGQALTPTAPNSYGTMSPAHSGMSSGGQAGMHHSAMGTHSRHMMQSSRTPSSQDAAVDQLNDQSLRAARQGQAFNGPAGGGMAGSSGGSMSDMPGGAMSGSSMPGGSMPASSMPGGTMPSGAASGSSGK